MSKNEIVDNWRRKQYCEKDDVSGDKEGKYLSGIRAWCGMFKCSF